MRNYNFWNVIDVCSECFPGYMTCPFYVGGTCHVADENFKPSQDIPKGIKVDVIV
jgi:hypothetical protein